MAKDITGDNIMAEKGTFTFSVDKGGEEEVPFVYLKNLIASYCGQYCHTTQKACAPI